MKSHAAACGPSITKLVIAASLVGGIIGYLLGRYER